MYVALQFFLLYDRYDTLKLIWARIGGRVLLSPCEIASWGVYSTRPDRRGREGRHGLPIPHTACSVFMNFKSSTRLISFHIYISKLDTFVLNGRASGPDPRGSKGGIAKTGGVEVRGAPLVAGGRAGRKAPAQRQRGERQGLGPNDNGGVAACREAPVGSERSGDRERRPSGASAGAGAKGEREALPNRPVACRGGL